MKAAPNRVAEGIAPLGPPHHLACGSALGGSGQVNGGDVHGWSLRTSVMQLDPLCLQVRHALFPQPRIVQRALHDPVAAHPPVTAPTLGGFHDFTGINAQCDQMLPPGARTLPLFPVTAPHASSQPLVQCQHLAIGVADPKIVQPATA